MIIISSARDGFRRCGVAHPAAPTSYADDYFDADQLAILQAEPMLTVALAETDGGEKKNQLSRGERLSAACAQLDADTENQEHWTVAGEPQIKALEALSGEKKVTAAERDAAWNAFNEAGGR